MELRHCVWCLGIARFFVIALNSTIASGHYNMFDWETSCAIIL